MYDSLLFWGVPKIYQLGFGVRAAGPDQIPEKILRRIHRKTDVTAEKIRRNAGRSGVSVQGRFWQMNTPEIKREKTSAGAGLKIFPEFEAPDYSTEGIAESKSSGREVNPNRSIFTCSL